MTDKKISQLPAAASLDGTELVPIVQAADNAAATTAQFMTYIGGSFVPYTGAVSDLNLGSNKYIGAGLKAATSAGVLVESNSGTDVLLLGAGGGAGATFYGGVNVAGTLSLTATYSRIDMSAAGTNTVSLYAPFTPTDDWAYTLPDRSGELATIFTPIADTIASIDSAFNVTSLNTSTYPSLTELSYVKGVTSAIQTQLNAKPVKTQTQCAGNTISGALADQDYTIAIKMAFAGEILETTTQCASGTATATFKINTTALGGTANSVSSSRQSQAHSTDNVFNAGDDLFVTISSNAACIDMSFMIKYERVLD